MRRSLKPGKQIPEAEEHNARWRAWGAAQRSMATALEWLEHQKSREAQALALGGLRGLVKRVGGADKDAARSLLDRVERIKSSRYRAPDWWELESSISDAKREASTRARDARRRAMHEEASHVLLDFAHGTTTPRAQLWSRAQDWRDLTQILLDQLLKTSDTDEGYPPGVAPRARMRWLLADPMIPWAEFMGAGSTVVSRKTFGLAIVEATPLELALNPSPAEPFWSVAVHPDQTDEGTEEISQLFQETRLSFWDSSLFPKSSPWFIRPTVLERERRRILEMPSNSKAATLAKRLELSALALTLAGTHARPTEIDPEDRAYLLAAAEELFESSVFVFYSLDPPSGTDRTARVVDAVRDAKKLLGGGASAELRRASSSAGWVSSKLSDYLKDLGATLPRRGKDAPIEREVASRVAPEVSRKIFGQSTATTSKEAPALEPAPEHSWTELRAAHGEGMRTTRAGRDKVAQRLGFNWWENLELALEEMAEADGHYLLTGRERNLWTTREKVARILARKLGPGEELNYPRQQLEAVLMMSPSDFTAYQKAMRGRYQ